MSPAKHLELTGADNRLILENLTALSKIGAPVEIRLLVIPGYNDDEDNLRQTADFFKTISGLTLIRPLPYHALSTSKYASLGKEYRYIETTSEELDAAKRVGQYFEQAGFPIARPD
jgi:pyruvate formate lyase activating enzyme